MKNSKKLEELQKVLDKYQIDLTELLEGLKKDYKTTVDENFYDQCPKKYQAKIDDIVEYTNSLSDDLIVIDAKSYYGMKIATDNYCLWTISKSKNKYVIKIKLERKKDTKKIKELGINASVFKEIEKTISNLLNKKPIEVQKPLSKIEPKAPIEPVGSFYKTASLEEKRILDEFYKLVMSFAPKWELIDKPHMYLFVRPMDIDKESNIIWIEKNYLIKKLELHYVKDYDKRDPIILTDRDLIECAKSILRIAIDDFIGKARERVDRCMCNADYAEDYSEEDLLDMANWDVVSDEIKIIGRMKIEDDYEIPYSSSEEEAIIKYLKECKYYKILRAQSFSIEYTTPNSINSKNYYPDLIMLTHNDKIAIVEVKQLANFSYYINLAKYEAIKDYCEENGYMYCMIDKNFTSLTDVIYRKVNSEIEREFMKRIKSKNVFGMSDIREMRHMFKKNEYEMMADIQSIIINNGLVNFDKFDTEINCKNLRRMKFKLI